MFVVLLVNNECFVFALFLAFLTEFNTIIILLALTGNHNWSLISKSFIARTINLSFLQMVILGIKDKLNFWHGLLHLCMLKNMISSCLQSITIVCLHLGLKATFR